MNTEYLDESGRASSNVRTNKPMRPLDEDKYVELERSFSSQLICDAGEGVAGLNVVSLGHLVEKARKIERRTQDFIHRPRKEEHKFTPVIRKRHGKEPLILYFTNER